MGDGAPGCTLYVVCMVVVYPALIVPRAQGKDGHVPADKNESPLGVGSLSITLVAVLGPPFVTVMV